MLGKRLDIDASTLKATASMRSLEKRQSGESYNEYVRKLAVEACVDPEDDAAVRRFDRKRKDKKVFDDEWHNPNDPGAKIGYRRRRAENPTRGIWWSRQKW